MGRKNNKILTTSVHPNKPKMIGKAFSLQANRMSSRSIIINVMISTLVLQLILRLKDQKSIGLNTKPKCAVNGQKLELAHMVTNANLLTANLNLSQKRSETLTTNRSPATLFILRAFALMVVVVSSFATKQKILLKRMLDPRTSRSFLLFLN